MKQVFKSRLSFCLLTFLLVTFTMGKFFFSKAHISVYAANPTYCVPDPLNDCEYKGSIKVGYKLVDEGETISW